MRCCWGGSESCAGCRWEEYGLEGSLILKWCEGIQSLFALYQSLSTSFLSTPLFVPRATFFILGLHYIEYKLVPTVVVEEIIDSLPTRRAFETYDLISF